MSCSNFSLHWSKFACWICAKSIGYETQAVVFATAERNRPKIDENFFAMYDILWTLNGFYQTYILEIRILVSYPLLTSTSKWIETITNVYSLFGFGNTFEMWFALPDTIHSDALSLSFIVSLRISSSRAFFAFFHLNSESFLPSIYLSFFVHIIFCSVHG